MNLKVLTRSCVVIKPAEDQEDVCEVHWAIVADPGLLGGVSPHQCDACLAEEAEGDQHHVIAPSMWIQDVLNPIFEGEGARHFLFFQGCFT